MLFYDLPGYRFGHRGLGFYAMSEDTIDKDEMNAYADRLAAQEETLVIDDEGDPMPLELIRILVNLKNTNRCEVSFENLMNRQNIGVIERLLQPEIKEVVDTEAAVFRLST